MSKAESNPGDALFFYEHVRTPRHPPPNGTIHWNSPPQPLSPALHQTPYFHLSGNEWDIGLPVFYREMSIAFGPFNPPSFQVQKRRKPA